MIGATAPPTRLSISGSAGDIVVPPVNERASRDICVLAALTRFPRLSLVAGAAFSASLADIAQQQTATAVRNVVAINQSDETVGIPGLDAKVRVRRFTIAWSSAVPV